MAEFTSDWFTKNISNFEHIKKNLEINFGKDKEPKYILDDVSRTIYYLSESKEMRAIKY